MTYNVFGGTLNVAQSQAPFLDLTRGKGIIPTGHITAGLGVIDFSLHGINPSPVGNWHTKTPFLTIAAMLC